MPAVGGEALAQGRERVTRTRGTMATASTVWVSRIVK